MADDLTRARALAVSLMRSQCRIERTGPVLTDDAGTDSTPTRVVYEGPCRVRPAATAALTPSPNAPAETWQYKVSIPVGDEDVRSFDSVVFTACAEDPSLVGRRMQVRNIDRGTSITARRIWCTEVSR